MSIKEQYRQGAKRIMDKLEGGVAYDIFCLKMRWQDEKEYECFAEYRERVKALFAEKGLKALSVSQAFTITVEQEKGLPKPYAVCFTAGGSIKIKIV